MKYDFTSILDRHGKDAIAVDHWFRRGDGSRSTKGRALMRSPMWVADMNFPTVPTVQEGDH